MTTLVTIGCSHTAGSMIDGRSGTSWENKAKSFGGLLAEKYSLSHFNLGVPGGSNEYIYRATIRFINNFMYDHDDYIFLLGWTSTNRFELRYPEKSRHVHKTVSDFVDQKYIPFTLGTDPKLFHTKEVQELLKYSPLLFYEHQLETDWAMYAYTLQQLFEKNKIKYYMMNTCHDLPVNEQNELFIENLNTDFYYNPVDFDSSMLYYALNRGYEKTKCWHIKADGHKLWAEHLDSLMSAQGLFANITQPKIVPKDDSIRIGGKYITYNDINQVLTKYKIEARPHLDVMYDRIYIQFPTIVNTQIADVKINIINKELVKRFGTSAKVSKYDSGLYEMDDTYMIEHFRKMS